MFVKPILPSSVKNIKKKEAFLILMNNVNCPVQISNWFYYFQLNFNFHSLN